MSHSPSTNLSQTDDLMTQFDSSVAPQNVAEVLARAQMAIVTATFFDDVVEAVVAGGVTLTNARCGALWLREREFSNLSLALGGSDAKSEAALVNAADVDAAAQWICVFNHSVAPNGEVVIWRRGEENADAMNSQHAPQLARPSRAVEKAAQGETASDDGNGADGNLETAIPLLKNGVVVAVLQLGWNKTQTDVLDNRVLDDFSESAATGLTKARLFEQIESAKCEWETTFDGMVDGVLVERGDGTVLRANLVAAAFYGCKVAQLVGRTSAELCARLADYQQLRALKSLAGDSSGRDVQTGEFRFGTPARIILETVSALRLSPYMDGRVRPLASDDDRRRVVRVLRDITEQRRLEEQLIQSEKLAALGELISGFAHELNNPLTTVSGYAQLLQEDAAIPAHARRQIERIYEDASRASRIVANLLSFARREDTQYDATDINDALRHLAEMRTYQLQAENVRLSFQYSNDLPLVTGDSHQLQQVFLNIINNAQQALHEWRGGGTIEVETRLVPVGGAPGVLISFTDNGPGIAPDHLRRIFDPFWTTKQAGEGTGLGMSISLDIVSRHGGRIWAESTLGQGARFFIELPGASSDPSPNATSSDSARNETSDLSSTEIEELAMDDEPSEDSIFGAQILVVDDEEPVILLMSEVLGLDDHEVTPAFNGGEALALLQERDFDLIISDVRMPAVGGPTFFEILQTARPDLLPRVVFVTGDTMSRSTQDFLKQANRPMLAKPFDPDRLRSLVRDQLKRNR